MTNRHLLIIFARNPQLGKVKTRLAKDIGPDQTLKIYKHFLEHILHETKDLKQDKAVFYSDFIDDSGIFNPSLFKLYKQEGSDLGERMKNAFSQGFSEGYEKIILIGTDIPDLTRHILNQAFAKLDESDFVIGPAPDGGYYLIGCKKNLNSVFANIAWSTNQVLQQTINIINESGNSFSLLEKLNDVDTFADIPNSIKLKYQISANHVEENK